MPDKCSAVAEMGDRLATIDMGRKLGGLCPFLGGAGSQCNTMQRWGLESETRTSPYFGELLPACNDLRLGLKDLRLDLGLEAC